MRVTFLDNLPPGHVADAVAEAKEKLALACSDTSSASERLDASST